jgi:Ca2+-binding EF-hand superfamily protein
MGNCLHSYEKVYEHPNVQPHVKLFDAFRITAKDLSEFHDMFVLLDSNKNDLIEVDEFMKHLDITRTPFAYRIFRVMDEDSSGAVSFREFVMSIWNICTLDNDAFEHFIFDLFDKDCTEFLPVEDVRRILHEVYGEELQSNVHAKR